MKFFILELLQEGIAFAFGRRYQSGTPSFGDKPIHCLRHSGLDGATTMRKNGFLAPLIFIIFLASPAVGDGP
ncbi:MAG: hypothetical protein ACYTFO_05530, partial [Planctomycetota bacterium]